MASKNPFAALDDEEGAEGTPEAPPAPKEVKKDAPPRKDNPRPSDGSASRGGGRGDRRGDGRRPKREFDRHSGTGRGRAADGAEEKRGGAGRYNWGKDGAGTTQNDEAEDGAAREMTEEEKAAVEAAAEEKRKEEAQMTLEEYMKQKNASKEELNAPKEREPEKVDLGGMKLKEDEDEEPLVPVEVQKKKSDSKKKSGGKEKQFFTDVAFTTPPVDTGSPTGGRGRGRGGGRGGDRGGGGRGRGGGGRREGPANLNLADDSAFPSL